MAINRTTLSADTLSIEIYEVDIIADDKILYRITDVTTSGILYENSGYATESFASPDLTSTGLTGTATLTILAPTVAGNIQISSKRLRSSVITTNNYANQKTGEEIAASFTSTVDCVLATLKVVDTSVYPTLTTNFSAQVVFTYPSAVVAPETVTSTTKNDTYEPTYLYTGAYELVFSGSFTVQLGTSPYLTLRNYAFSETGTKSVTCNDDICQMRCTVAHLRHEWQKSESVADWNKWITASALLSEAIASLYYCGKDITDLIAQMDKYDCGCGDCTEGTPTLILPR
jgi:hypothetical protein